jgi:hypothetical protein
MCELTRKFPRMMGCLHPNQPGKFDGVERLVRAAERSRTIVRPGLGGVTRTFAPQRGANALITGLASFLPNPRLLDCYALLSKISILF